jgi:acyl homoserine lactone synthase
MAFIWRPRLVGVANRARDGRSKEEMFVIVVVERHNAEKYSCLLDQMFRLRARVFYDELGWDVQVADGYERDRYDDEMPVYVVYTDAGGTEVKGSLRLLPTTGPTVLRDFFPDTIPTSVDLRAPTIWECTRFCLDDQLLNRRRENRLFASTVLLLALSEVALRAGIESIVGNIDGPMLRLYRRVGCEVEILGTTLRYGKPVYLGLHPISDSLITKIRDGLDLPRAILDEARMVA